ncbi:hypothetical protein GCM10023189_25780 [Nibrella saemangeumensis]|uniref:Uncharacterized protein n=1 Tax=Nibrella saemangeumensis TaxID=1084526 RepID=A0ABP8MXA4_9BACT
MFYLRKHRFLLACLQFGLFLGIIISGVVFRHAHRLADGTIISHTHPYKPFNKGPFQPNTHTQQELIWLDQLAHSLFTDNTIPIIAFLILVVIVTIVWLPPLQFVTRSIRHCSHYRGPPNVSY